MIGISEQYHRRISRELDKLRTEQSRVNEKLSEAYREKEQLEHQLNRAENRAEYLKKGERAKRTHRLCVKGGVIEAAAPMLKDLSEKEFYDLMESVFALPQIQKMVKAALQKREM